MEAVPGVQEAMLSALRKLITGAGAKLGAAARTKASAALLELCADDNADVRERAGGALGPLLAHLPEGESAALLENELLPQSPDADAWQQAHGCMHAVSAALGFAPSAAVVLGALGKDAVVARVLRCMGDDKAAVSFSAAPFFSHFSFFFSFLLFQ